MIDWAILLFAILMALLIGQAVLVVGFIRVLGRQDPAQLPDEACPRAAVILCLRGSDPFLDRCVRALLRQDYPHYDVHLVFDHETDPARSVVDPILQAEPSPHVYCHILSEPQATCGLKCSSLVQAIKQLDAEYEIVAQLDADTIAHPTWLRELATAFQESSVGAATGNRWYMPETASWGALVRYSWNAAAVVQMYWYRIAWGGTLAVRHAVFQNSDLLQRWSHAFCEDTMLYRQLQPQGRSLKFVPSLLMVNREDCDLSGYFRWTRRQLLTARLYHPGWAAVVFHGISTFLAPAAALGIAVWAMVARDWPAAAWAGGGLVLFEVIYLGMLLVLEAAARRVVRRRGESTAWFRAATAFRLPLAMLLTQLIYPVVVLSALRVRQVEWRGVSYRIDGPWQIRLLEYRPYGEVVSPAPGGTDSL